MTTMLQFVVQAAVIYTISWAFWKFLRPYVAKGTLGNVQGPPSVSLITGNLTQIFNLNAWEFHKDIARKYGAVVKIRAMFGETKLYVFDPKALHQIIVKDQYIFEETDEFFASNKLMFGDGLLATEGEHHRKQRKMLNPVFSINHMRHMTPIFWDISRKLKDLLELKVKKGETEIDVTHWVTRTALELIGQGGMGYSFDELTEDAVPHKFCISVQQLIPTLFSTLFLRLTTPRFLLRVGSPQFRRWLVNMLPSKNAHRLRDIIDTMHNVSVEILDSKQRALEQGDEAVANQVAQGKDIISILLKSNMEAKEEDKLTEKEILGQMSTFTFAAMDTTSAALSRILYLLAYHPSAQDKLRAELREAQEKHGEGELSYDELVALPYLDAICRETLRLYPPVPIVERVARQDVVVPLARPVKGVDGSEMTEIAMPKNTHVFISILSANRNPDIWGPDSFEWKPERWQSPLPDSVPDAHIPGIYSHLMTFLGGGRACIGFKFSQLEMKVVLSLLVRSLKFSLSEKVEIAWQMHGITSPAVVGEDSLKPSLPMNISLA